MQKKKIVFDPPRKRTKSFSTLDIKMKRPCFKSKGGESQKQDKSTYEEYYFEPDGPTVITHIHKKIKHTVTKEKQISQPYDYFGNHKECPETVFYNHNLMHPKILRHHSKDKNKEKKPTKEIIESKQRTFVVSNSIRDSNKFDTFMNLVKTNKLVV